MHVGVGRFLHIDVFPDAVGGSLDVTNVGVFGRSVLLNYLLAVELYGS